MTISFHLSAYDLKVSQMKAEFFSPNEDVILQNEAPTDFYIVVNGKLDLIQSKNGLEQDIGEAKKGDICGEVAVLCYRPQLFTVRTRRLCQLLRINRTNFLNIVQSNVGDGNIIMNNLLQVICIIKFKFFFYQILFCLILENILAASECYCIFLG